MDALKELVAPMLKEEKPQFNIGDVIRIGVKIREGEKERIQAFEGTVIAKNNSGIAETFTVRRIAYGVGVERVFPIHSPNVTEIKVIHLILPARRRMIKPLCINVIYLIIYPK